MIRVLPILVIFSLLVLPVYGISDTKLFNDFTYIDSSGAPVIVGEVINWSKDPIKSVEVRANFIEPSGKILDSGTTFAAIDLIEPGQRAPFMVTGDIEYALSVNSVELNVVNFTKGYSKPSKLEIININEFSDGVSAVHISGEIRHTGDKMATMSKVYATFYDENNRVVGFTSTFTKSIVKLISSSNIIGSIQPNSIFAHAHICAGYHGDEPFPPHEPPDINPQVPIPDEE